MRAMKQNWLVFYCGGEEVLAYTVSGTFPGEMEETREQLAYELGVDPDDITCRVEEW